MLVPDPCHYLFRLVVACVCLAFGIVSLRQLHLSHPVAETFFRLLFAMPAGYVVVTLMLPLIRSAFSAARWLMRGSRSAAP